MLFSSEFVFKQLTFIIDEPFSLTIFVIVFILFISILSMIKHFPSTQKIASIYLPDKFVSSQVINLKPFRKSKILFSKPF